MANPKNGLSCQQHLSGGLPATLCAIKVGVKTDQGQTVPLCCHVLVGVVKVQTEAVGYLFNPFHIGRAKPDQIHVRFKEQVINYLRKDIATFPAEKNDAHRVQGEIRDEQPFGRYSREETFHIATILLLKEKFKEDVGVQKVHLAYPPFQRFVLECHRCILASKIFQCSLPVQFGLSRGARFLFEEQELYEFPHLLPGFGGQFIDQSCECFHFVHRSSFSEMPTARPCKPSRRATGRTGQIKQVIIWLLGRDSNLQPTG